jgi:hypothetical protein
MLLSRSFYHFYYNIDEPEITIANGDFLQNAQKVATRGEF